MKLLILTPLLFLFISSSWASEKAQVIMLRGKVTKLEPGAHQAHEVKRGDWLMEDTSLVTKEKSFIKLRFKDNSTMNVGPKSMVVINKMPQEKANMVNLLKGMIKAEVKKDSKKKSKTKMLLRTRSAVMGVRGTKFQSTYNHANKRTSLVTVEGKVAMVKKISKDEVVASQKTKIQDVDKLDEMFETPSDKIVEVSAGEYSGVAESIEAPSQPVKIAPKQYDAIAKSMGSKKRSVEVMQTTKEEAKAAKVMDKTGALKPKAGGFVDFSTGLYVAPEAGAKLDKATGTYNAKKVGGVNMDTGDYVPPKGIIVDAKKGFIVDTKEVAKIASNEEREDLNKTLNAMNAGVKKQVTTVEQIEKMEKAAPKKEKSSWGPKNHIISATLHPYSEVLEVKNKQSNSSAEFYTEKAHWIILTWKQEWNKKWSSRFRLGGSEYEIDESDVKVYNSDGDDSKFFAIGINYKIGSRLNLITDFVSKDMFYVVPRGGDGVNIETSSVDSVDIGLEYDMLKWYKLDTKLIAILSIIDGHAPAQEDNLKSDFFAFNIQASGYYHWKKNMGLNTSLTYQKMDAENSDFAFNRNSYGVMLDFVYDI